MDAKGEILAVQGDRSVDGFRKTFHDVQTYADLKRRVDAGEKGLGVELMEAQWQLGKLSWAEAKQQAKGLGKLTPKEQARVTQIVLDAEVVERALESRDKDKAKAVYARFKELSESGYVPGEKAKQAYWRTLLNGADQSGDLKLYRAAVEQMHAMYDDNPRAAKYLKGLDERLAEMEAGAGA